MDIAKLKARQLSERLDALAGAKFQISRLAIEVKHGDFDLVVRTLVEYRRRCPEVIAALAGILMLEGDAHLARELIASLQIESFMNGLEDGTRLEVCQ